MKRPAGHRAALAPLRPAAVAALLAAAGSLAWAQPTAVPAASTGSPTGATGSQADQGRRIYTSLCARCHGLNLVANGIGFDLRQFPRDGEERFRRSVTQGLRAMPAWDGVLKPGDLEALWAYIGAVNGW